MKPLLIALFTTLAATLTCVAWANEAEDLTVQDQEGLAALRESAENVPRLRDADAAFEQGRWQEAAALYGAFPTDNEDAARYPLRRRCQALTELGQKTDAVRACRALLDRVIPNAADLQAHIAALMLGSGRPTEDELREATLLLRKIENAEPDSVFYEAARCSIAARIDDRPTFNACSAKLEQLAPHGRLSRHFAASAAAPAARNAWLKFGLFGGLLLALLLTLGHRFFAGGRKLAASACVLWLSWPGAAAAQDFGFIKEGPQNNSSSGPQSIDPGEVDPLEDEMKLLQELTDKVKDAEQMITKEDWVGAVGKYNEIVVTAPYIARAWRRLCEGYSHLNQPVEGAHSCRQVLASAENNAWDRAMLVHFLLTGPESTKPEVRDEARKLADEAIAKFPDERWGYDAQCEIALGASDLPTLKACSKQLDRLAHDDRKTIAILFSIALNEKRFSDAEDLIERARVGGMEESGVENMKANLAQREPFWRRLRHTAPLGLGLGALAAVLALLGSYLMNARKRARGRADLGQSHV